jgi:hypothetical protein
MVKWSADRFGGADVVLIEAKASGLDVMNELRRLYARAPWGVVPINPKGPTFAQGLVYAPARDWATMVKGPTGEHPPQIDVEVAKHDYDLAREPRFSRSSSASQMSIVSSLRG